ncbi:hypothetical protein QYE76_044777 [Lolium multiflorum]|uniref:CCHC-type domain-containing protein n=1 Tax=Lolium multiflorum TaxID=4521 RepID=A0AAD8WXD8_LOLMU|nr:hypothetical protein QYE76_044777 [Lolium multiflorum]
MPTPTTSTGPNESPHNAATHRTGSNAVPITPKDKATITCYECGIVGHYSNECPKRLAKIAANTAAHAQQQRRVTNGKKFAPNNPNNRSGRLFHDEEAQEAPDVVLASPDHPDHHRAWPWHEGGWHWPGQSAPSTPRHASVRTPHALDAPEHGLDPSPPSSPTPLPLHQAPPLHPLARRHAQAPAHAPSPSSSSTFRRQYRGRFFIIASDPIALLLRQLAVEHRHDATYTTPSSPCPFAHRRRRAMLDLHSHPQHLLPSINRALPRPISSHSSLLLPSLLLLEPIPSQFITGAAPI